MAGMFFHVEERKAWIRTHTHTVVYDRDPDFPRFSNDPSGKIKRMIRIWLAKPGAEQPSLHTYLGTVTFCFVGPSFRELCRLFHLTSRAAKIAGQSARELRRDLAALLRRYIHEEYNV
jgi:hypothetical protein